MKKILEKSYDFFAFLFYLIFSFCLFVVCFWIASEFNKQYINPKQNTLTQTQSQTPTLQPTKTIHPTTTLQPTNTSTSTPYPTSTQTNPNYCVVNLTAQTENANMNVYVSFEGEMAYETCRNFQSHYGVNGLVKGEIYGEIPESEFVCEIVLGGVLTTVMDDDIIYGKQLCETVFQK